MDFYLAIIIGFAISVVLTVLLAITVIPEKRRGCSSISRFLHDLFNADICVEKKIAKPVAKFLGTLLTLACLLVGFFLLFVENKLWCGIALMVFGTIVSRIVYELVMMQFKLADKIHEIELNLGNTAENVDSASEHKNVAKNESSSTEEQRNPEHNEAFVRVQAAAQAVLAGKAGAAKQDAKIYTSEVKSEVSENVAEAKSEVKQPAVKTETKQSDKTEPEPVEKQQKEIPQETGERAHNEAFLRVQAAAQAVLAGKAGAAKQATQAIQADVVQDAKNNTSKVKPEISQKTAEAKREEKKPAAKPKAEQSKKTELKSAVKKKSETSKRIVNKSKTTKQKDMRADVVSVFKKKKEVSQEPGERVHNEAFLRVQAAAQAIKDSQAAAADRNMEKLSAAAETSENKTTKQTSVVKPAQTNKSQKESATKVKAAAQAVKNSQKAAKERNTVVPAKKDAVKKVSKTSTTKNKKKVNAFSTIVKRRKRTAPTTKKFAITQKKVKAEQNVQPDKREHNEAFMRVQAAAQAIKDSQKAAENRNKN